MRHLNDVPRTHWLDKIAWVLIVIVGWFVLTVFLAWAYNFVHLKP